MRAIPEYLRLSFAHIRAEVRRAARVIRSSLIRAEEARAADAVKDGDVVEVSRKLG